MIAPNLPGAQRIAELCGAAALAAYTLFLLTGLFWPSPSSIELTGSGVKLVYPNGQVRDFDWDEVAARAELWEVRVAREGSGVLPFAAVRLARPVPHNFRISPDGLDTLRRAASAAGLREIARSWQTAHSRDGSAISQKIRLRR